MKDLRKKPKWLECIKAYLGGYFWLPCCICGEKYGGHEKGGSLYLGNGEGQGVCINCADEAEKRNKKIFASETVDINGRILSN